jgi:uncharacterized protein YprB with RNaseH-like and TPR domain
MKHTKVIEKNELKPGFVFERYFGGRKIGILDIETTGLSASTARVILGGLITIEPGSDTMTKEEFFCEFNNDADEEKLLEGYMKAVRKTDVVVTYNGAHFDMPFLKERCARLGVEYEEGLPYNLDIYRILNKFSDFRRLLPNLKQKTVESYMGLWETRTDMISGADSVELYYEYLTRKEGAEKEALKSTIILHNSDDCAQLYRLLPILGKVDMHKAMFHLGFPVGRRLEIGEISVDKTKLSIMGKQNIEPIEYSAFERPGFPMEMHFGKETRRFIVDVPLVSAGGRDESAEIPPLLLADSVALCVNTSSIEDLPGIEKGFIIIKKGSDVNYITTNAFIRLVLEKIESRLWND